MSPLTVLTILVGSLLGFVALASASTRGRDFLARITSRPLPVGTIIAADDGRDVRDLFTFVADDGTSQRLVLAPDRDAVAEALLRDEGSPLAVSCLIPTYRVIRHGNGWAVCVLAPVWKYLGHGCEHDGRH